MQVPPEMAFRGVEPTNEMKARILDGIAKLEDVYPNLTSCRSMVADETPDQHSGNNYRVRLEVAIPSKNVIVDHTHPDPRDRAGLRQMITEAFATARKRLIKAKELQRGQE